MEQEKVENQFYREFLTKVDIIKFTVLFWKALAGGDKA